MARMSIDDMAFRDARVLRLAKMCGWSRRETIGCLLEVWSLCYDRVTAVLESEDISVIAGVDGFAQMMVDVGLAHDVQRLKGPHSIRICGAEDRIEYLKSQRASGRKGGLKSAEVRRNRAQQTSSEPSSEPSSELRTVASRTLQGSANPPDPVPDAASTPDLQDLPDVLSGSGVVVAMVSGASGTGAATVRDLEHPPILRPVPDLASCRRLVDGFVVRVNRSRIALSVELRIPGGVRPVASMGEGERMLMARLKESEDPAADLEHVLAVAEAEARSTGDIRWLGWSLAEEKSWRTKLGDRVDFAARRGQQGAPSAFSAVDDVVSAVGGSVLRGKP